MIGPVRTVQLVALALSACAADDRAPSWADLDRDERIVFMTEEVEPTMREIFIGFDATRFAAFGCPSCHGPTPEQSDYAMPAFLGPLPLEGTLEAAEMRNPEMTAFMLDEVFPTMAALLDEEKFAEVEAPDGFRCVRCHLVAP
jgi:hypothetical protein